MCDEDTARDAQAFIDQRFVTDAQPISRRRFAGMTGAVTATAGAAALLTPELASASPLVESDVLITTPDGEADCYFVHPAQGKQAGVLVWPDVLGLREAYRLMGKRLAAAGYAVLVVNPYYRQAKAPVVAPGASFQDPAVRERVIPFARALTPTTNVTDAKAFVGFLDAQPNVDQTRKIGTTGYCMTGSYVMRLAAAMPDRIGAGGSFHGGRLATDAADSPHQLASKMRAGFLIAIAANDDERDPEAKVKLREAFDQANVSAEIEVYTDTLHGWCPPDSPVYNEVQAEKAWSRLLALFERELA